MEHLKGKLIAIGALGALAAAGTLMTSREAAAQGGPRVSIVDPLPLPVTIVGNGNPQDRLLFRKNASLSFNTLATASSTFNAPADKQVIIDSVSGRCTVQTGALCNFSIAIQPLGTALYEFPASRIPTAPTLVGLDSFGFHETTRYVVRPGESYTIFLHRNNTELSTFASGNVTLIGHYVDCTTASSCPSPIE